MRAKEYTITTVEKIGDAEQLIFYCGINKQKPVTRTPNSRPSNERR